jgi:hypothetical protein
MRHDSWMATVNMDFSDAFLRRKNALFYFWNRRREHPQLVAHKKHTQGLSFQPFSAKNMNHGSNSTTTEEKIKRQEVASWVEGCSTTYTRT